MRTITYKIMEYSQNDNSNNNIKEFSENNLKQIQGVFSVGS